MRKITDFIVKARYLFLTLFIIIAGISLYLATKVNINDDIMKYLPKDSETKIGKDIMDKEFMKEDSSILNVMFKDLKDSEKEENLKKLASIEGVNEVSYDDTSNYNKDNYTLYVLNVKDYADSKTATNVYNYVKDNFKVAGLSGSIYDENKPILQLWIVIMAIACAMVILIILSDSYVEPWLYLISIGIAVFINKGTNIMFSSVSSITNSIVAILQLALSMDYSIMLSNRYKQEKEVHSNKIDAMKEALYQSFKAISSSSVTTIVGLLALVFMSFTIGKDLGFVLAKGVLLSLISIFFCLPALLLIFDDLIGKTKKKTPKFNLTKLGQFIYKTRYVQAVLIVILFGASSFFKGNIGILFTGSEQDKVGKVFPATNQVAIVYNNKYENDIASYCKDLEKDSKIDQVLCYSNTINEKLTYDEVNQKLASLGEDVNIDDYLIKLIYYNYYNQDEKNKMTLSEFVSFIKSDIYNNKEFSDKLDSKTKDNIELLENFTQSNLINKKRTVKEIANILGMKEEEANNILIYYNSKNISNKLSIKDFILFMLNDVALDSNYNANIDKETLANLQMLQKFTDPININKKMDASELANIFGIDENLVNELFLFYNVNKESTTKLTLNTFANFALSLANEDNYKNMFDYNVIEQLKKLQILSSEEVLKDLDIISMQEVLTNLGLKLDDNVLSLLYVYYNGVKTTNKLSLSEFANIALSMAQNDLYKTYFSEEIIEELKMIINLINNAKVTMPLNEIYEMLDIDNSTASLLTSYFHILGIDNITLEDFINTLVNNLGVKNDKLTLASIIIKNNSYSQKELATLLNQDETMIDVVFGVSLGELKAISINNLFNFLVQEKDNSLVSPYLKDNIDLLNSALLIINNRENTYNYTEISKLTNTLESDVSKIFGIYDYTYNKTLMSPYEFTNYILNNKDNDILANNLTPSMLNKLKIVKEVMDSSLNNIEYSSNDLSELLGINHDTMNLLYSLYNSKLSTTKQNISLKTYVDFIVKDVMNNKDYASKFSKEDKLSLTTVDNIMNNSLNKVKYTSKDAYNILATLSNDIDESLLQLVYIDFGSVKQYDDSWQMTLLEFVNFLNNDIITDKRFDDFIDSERRKEITDGKTTIDKAKSLLVSDTYSRVVLNTKYAFEDEEAYQFINNIEDKIGNKDDVYVVGNSKMAVEMSKTFNDELNKITILTMIFIFVVVAITFKDLIIPLVLVLIIQTAVYITMCGISFTSGSEYFIAILIVQAILMGATIDYAIVYTSYYRESRLTMSIKDSVINAYNRSIHTIISSSSILIIVTLVVANFASEIAAKICETISEGTFAAVILILFMLPGILATFDKLICRKGYYSEKKQNVEN